MITDRNEGSKSRDAFYQRVYVKLESLPFINRYLRKIQRRMELINQNDKYTIRKDSAKITLRAITIALVVLILMAWINRNDLFIMIVSFIGVIIVVENMTEQMINKVENKLLEQELEFFSEVRHAFHETNMVEEAIYDASLMDEQEIVSQANRIYEIMISADPEIELERYYDVAPNRFLKIFAGVSYLTKEYGDRKVNDISLYLKNMNNITQELQLEILKRDKLDYLFKSLTYIAVAPVLLIHPLRDWALNSFSSTGAFYEGKLGFFFEILLLMVIFISYSLLTRIKDNEERQGKYTSDDAWQERIYRLPIIEKIIDALIPNNDKPSYLRITKLLKDTASTLKLEWLYVTKAICAVAGFAVALLIATKMHDIAVESILYDASNTGAGGIMGQMSAADKKKAESISASDRYFVSKMLDTQDIINTVTNNTKEEAIKKIEMQIYILSITPLTDNIADKYAEKIFKNMKNRKARSITGDAEIQDAILKAGIEMPRDNFVGELSQKIINIAKENDRSEILKDDVKQAMTYIYTIELSAEQLYTISERIYEKLKSLTSEYFKWTEMLIAIMIGVLAYQIPNMLMRFQKKMRQMEMDDEVMQFQTIILMLMYIERVSVESILEWLARFAKIFKEPLHRCLNNYESGAYEALEALKEEVSFKQFVRIVESLQSAVENVKITDAFDELETERAFFQEKRKEANERLINRKAKIGKFIGFTPMVLLFVGYLIAPLIWTSITDMSKYFEQMGSMI